jgi:hypothetical protein
MEDRQMNEMTTTNSLPDLNPGKATLLEMRADSTRFPRVKSVSREQAVFEMTKIVTQAFLYRGQAADVTTIQFISSSLVDELLADRFGAASISFAEIQVVVKRAILGGSDMFGVSVASLYKVIMEYVKGEGHINQQKVWVDRRKKEQEMLQASAVNTMIRSFTGEFAKDHKLNK